MVNYWSMERVKIKEDFIQFTVQGEKSSYAHFIVSVFGQSARSEIEGQRRM